MRITKNENGASTLAVWFWLILLSLVIYVGYKLLPMYIDYERMKDEMQAKASVAQVLKDEEVRADLVQKAKDLGLPLGPDDFVISRDVEHNRMTIRTSWDVEVHFPYDIYVRTYHFEPIVDEDMSRERR